MESIKNLDEKEALDGLLEDERILRLVAKDEYGWVVEIEEITWKKKSKVHWLKEGDENTFFFLHKMTICQRNINTIHCLKVGSVYLDKEGDIRAKLEEYYMSLFFEQCNRWSTVDGLSFPQISRCDAAWLERPFLEDEVKVAIWELAGDKAPRPDGFVIAFNKVYWEVLKRDMMLVFDDFFHKKLLIFLLSSKRKA